jgi:hypothetical protein
MKNLIAWFTSHWPVILPVLVVVVNDLRNGMASYPKVNTALEIFGDLISWHQRADSPGTLKMPFTRSKDPNGIAQPTPAEPAK